ncbi:hypothetical protein [Trichocoleus sp. FACHB-46]|nr:hypothetical protein [Trichocoleus sp. FACHB-46]
MVETYTVASWSRNINPRRVAAKYTPSFACITPLNSVSSCAWAIA